MMSSLSNSRTAVCTIFSGNSGAVTLPTQAVATPPEALIELTTPSATSPSRSLTTTWAPSSANNVATARPMPRPEPVTIADLPSSSFIFVSILSSNQYHGPPPACHSLKPARYRSRYGFFLHWEHFVQFGRRRLGTVLAKLESLGVPDSKASIVAITPKEQIAVIIRHGGVSVDQPVADEVLSRLVIFWHARQITPHPRILVGELRRHRLDAGALLVKHVVNGDDDHRVERIWLFEIVGVVKDDRVLRAWRRVGHEERRGDQHGGVFHQHASVSVIGVIIVRPRAEHYVGLPLSDQPGDGPTIFNRRQQLAVVNVQHLRLNAERLGASFHFRRAPERQRPAGHREMADVAVGSRHEFYLVPLRGPLRGHACRFQFAIIRVCAKCDNSQCHF